MEWVKILLVAPLSYVALFIITRLIGYRQISQLSIFDYINGITIGSIAAEMATELERPLRPLLAMAVYCLLVVLTSFATSKSIRLRRLITGRTLILLENGTLYRDNLKKCKLDLNEFLSQCRGAGYFDLNELQLAVMETSGKISFLPKTAQRPATPQDIGVAVTQAQPQIDLVIDGRVLPGNLRYLGFDETWLKRQLAAQDACIADAFLVTGDRSGRVTVFPREDRPMTRDIFM